MEGTAYITATHPAAEIRALTPAIAKAYAAFEAQNAAAEPILADRKRLRRDLNALRDSKRPIEEYDQTRDDKLAREIARLDTALTRNAYAARKLAVDYLVAVIENPRKDEARQGAARLALKAHEDAVAALAALEDALTRRETFYDSAGRPAEYKHYVRQHNYKHTSGAFRAAHADLALKVATFPASDVQTVADGGEVMTLAQIEAAQQRAMAEAAEQMKASVREKNTAAALAYRFGALEARTILATAANSTERTANNG